MSQESGLAAPTVQALNTVITSLGSNHHVRSNSITPTVSDKPIPSGFAEGESSFRTAYFEAGRLAALSIECRRGRTPRFVRALASWIRKQSPIQWRELAM